MVELKQQDYQFLWSFSLLVLFQGQLATPDKTIFPMDNLKSSFGSDSPVADKHSIAMKFYEMILPVFGFLSAEKFFGAGFLDLCRELLQVFSYYIFLEDILDSHAISVLSQIVQNCPKNFFETGEFAYQAAELCLSFMFKFLQSAHVNASSHTNWEDKISVSFTSAKNLLMRLESKQLQLALPFLLVGYKCVGEASNDVWLLNPVDYVQSVVVMLKNLVAGNSKLDDDAICYLRTITRTCLNMNINMTNECIKNIHQLEDKMTNSSKLRQKKLAFALEQIITFAKLAYEIELISDNQESKPIFYSLLCQCKNSFHEVLKDQHIQVQATALQTVTGVIRDSNAESNTFITFFIGELLNEIFWIIKQALKKPVKREAITIAGDCLKILMLLHTSSKAAESQTSLMSLLLEAIVMVLLASENDSSQEVRELKTASVRLVSQLAQSQTSAGYFKDALLSMPSTRRQKLQEIIRASVTQDQISTPTKSQMPPLVIKMPSQTEETKRQISPPLAATIVGDDSKDDNEEDEEEDDWDTFQSFPASTSEPKSTENVSSDKNVLQENTTLTKSSSTSTSTTSSEDEDEGEKYSAFADGFKFQYNEDRVSENNEDEDEDDYEDEGSGESGSKRNREGVDLSEYSRENIISGDGDEEEEEEVTNENILDQLSKVLTDMAEESSKSSSTSESDSDEKGSTHSNVASEKDEHDKDDSQSGNEEKASTHGSADDDFSGQQSTSQYVDEEEKSTHSNGASEKDEREQVEDSFGQPSTSPSANEEKPTQSTADEDVPGQHSTSEFVSEEEKSTHSNAASEKDEREKDEDFLSQNSASQSVNEEKRSSHSSADEDFSGQDSTFQFVSDEKESTHGNVVSQNDEREKEEDLSGLHTSSPSVAEEKGSTHSDATLEKDEPEQVGDFSDQHSTSQSVNVEKESTHSNAALEQDDDFSGQDSTSHFLNEEESTHSNVSPKKDERIEEEDFSGQHTTQSVNEEQGDNASVKDETEHDASFSDQHSIGQSGNEEKGSTHSNSVSEKDERAQDEDLSGKQSLPKAED